MRRILILFVTGLLVARPIVPGEDPGLLRSVSGPSGMVLTLLWFTAGVVWGAWRLKSGRGDWYAGFIEVALVAATICVFVSAEVAASYKHPARLIAWEWAGLLLAFCLIRQLAVSREEKQGLFACLLASGVTLAVQAVYKAIQAATEGIDPAPAATATFAFPDSLAVVLVLILPALAWTVVLYHSSHGPTWPTIAAGIFALLGAAAIGLTYRVSAYIAVLLVGLPAAYLTRRYWLGKRYLALGLLAVMIAANWGIFRAFILSKDDEVSETTARLDTWATTWKMIEARPMWGWGPGQFSRTFPRFMDETAAEIAAEPHNFVLELWANCGPFAALAVIVAMAVFFFQIVQTLFSREPPANARHALAGGSRLNDETNNPQSIRWEFYLGGTFGLLLGFVLRAQELGPANILPEGFMAAGRAVIWFGAFALFERASWTDRSRSLALAAGIVGVLVVLTFSDGIGYPSLAGLLWAAVALAVKSLSPAPVGWLSRNRVALALPLPVLAGVALAYFLGIFTPVASSASHVQEAFKASAYYFVETQQHPQQWNTKKSLDYIQTQILPHLRKAADADSADARPLVNLAIWTGELFAKAPENAKDAEEARIWAKKAEELDREGPTGYETLYSLYVEFAKIATSKAEQARKHRESTKNQARQRDYVQKEKENRDKARLQLSFAAKALHPYLAYSPADSFVRYQLAEAHYGAEEWEELIEQAEAALRLNEACRRPRKLPDEKCESLEVWLEVARLNQALEPGREGR